MHQIPSHAYKLISSHASALAEEPSPLSTYYEKDDESKVRHRRSIRESFPSLSTRSRCEGSIVHMSREAAILLAYFPSDILYNPVLNSQYQYVVSQGEESRDHRLCA